MNTQINEYVTQLLTPYISDPQWHPYVLIGVAILLIIIILVIFYYIRSFLSWILGVNEVARLQKEQNKLLRELLVIQSDQLELMEALFVANSEEDTDKNENDTEITSCPKIDSQDKQEREERQQHNNHHAKNKNHHSHKKSQ